MVGGAFFLFLAVGVPIAFALIALAIVMIWASGDTVLFLSFPQVFFGGLENYGLLALPLFILLGEFMNSGGIGRRLMAFALALLGPVRGGLAYVNLVANMMMASILGSTVAQITIMSRIAVPEIKRTGYRTQILSKPGQDRSDAEKAGAGASREPAAGGDMARGGAPCDHRRGRHGRHRGRCDTRARPVLPLMADEYRLGLITPPPHQWTVRATEMAAEIREKTEGRVDIVIFPSGQLGNEAQMLQQLQTGALDFAFLTLGEFASRDQNYGIFLAPYVVDDVAGARSLLKGRTAQKLLDGMADFGLVGLGWGMAGMRMIVTAFPVESVDDLKGKKIRTIPFAPEMAFWEAVGAAPTPMPLPALYDAFANGQVDGMQIDVEGTWNSKYYEHAQSIIISDHMMFPMAVVGSGRKWGTISETDRVIIADAIAAKMDGLVSGYADIDADYRAKLEKTDVPVIAVDRAWFGPAIDNWYTEWRDKAPMLNELEAESAGQ